MALANPYTALDDLAVLQRPLLPLGAYTNPLDNNSPKVEFPGLGGRSGRTARRTKRDRMLNTDPVNPVWGPMRPWGPRYGPVVGGAGGHFIGWGPVLSVGDPTHKKNSDTKKRKS